MTFTRNQDGVVYQKNLAPVPLPPRRK